MLARMSQRKGTAAEWSSVNPVLRLGELGVETDTGLLKVGDGTSPWTALPEMGSMQQALAAQQAAQDAQAAQAAAETARNQAQSVVLQGSGIPEGVVTASPGALYSDLAVTRGAAVWRKATGIGNTGWRVVSGDTGWRNVTSLLTSQVTTHPTAGFAVMRRRDDHITIRARLTIHPDSGLIGATRGGVQVLNFPNATAWRSLYEFVPLGYAALWPAGTLFQAHNLSTGGRLDAAFTGAGGTWGASDTVNIHCEYPARDAWPSTLPGTPA